MPQSSRKWHKIDKFLDITQQTHIYVYITKQLLFVNFLSDPESESEPTRSPESESESEQPHHDSAPLLGRIPIYKLRSLSSVPTSFSNGFTDR